MKAILEFDLPDDKTDFILATRASAWYLVAWDMAQYLRDRLKYEELEPIARQAIYAAQEALWQAVESRGLSMDDGE